MSAATSPRGATGRAELAGGWKSATSDCASSPRPRPSADGALETGLSVLYAESAEVQRQLLAASAVVALSNAGAAQLWACTLEACSDVEVVSVAALAAEITTQVGTISAALLSAALGV